MRWIAVLLATSIPTTSHADGWVVVEAPVALVTSDAQANAFRTGTLPAVGAYAENERYAIGLRVRGGVLRNGAPPGNNVMDPGLGGLLTGGIAMRLSLFGGWVEAVGGGGMTGRDVVPAAEVGVGWTFTGKTVDVGVGARHVWVVSQRADDAFGTARLVLLGVDVRFGRDRSARSVRVATAPRPAPPPPTPIRVEVAPDADRIVDREDSCVRDPAACPQPVVLSEDIVILDDRIVLDERVLFAVDRARVRSRGREVLARLARVWREHPEWRHLTIEGHADVRGTDDYNQRLSKLRADRVRAVMAALGCPDDAMTAVGHGRTRPRAEGNDETAHERNRRVEFVIDRSTR